MRRRAHHHCFLMDIIFCLNATIFLLTKWCWFFLCHVKSLLKRPYKKCAFLFSELKVKLGVMFIIRWQTNSHKRAQYTTPIHQFHFNVIPLFCFELITGTYNWPINTPANRISALKFIMHGFFCSAKIAAHPIPFRSYQYYLIACY